jgi:hypothetical protein
MPVIILLVFYALRTVHHRPGDTVGTQPSAAPQDNGAQPGR